MAGFFLNIPETVSPQAQTFLRTLTDPALKPAFPMPDDIEGWKRLQASAEADGRARSEPLLKRYEHKVSPRQLGGVPVWKYGQRPAQGVTKSSSTHTAART